MNRTLYIFLLLLSPLFVKAGGPIKCDCANDEKGVVSLGLLRQYHEMVSALEKAEQTEEAVKSLYKIYEFKIDPSSTQKQQESFILIVSYCRKIAGNNEDAFLNRAKELGLLKGKNEISNLDLYKARLACVAVWARKDTFPAQTGIAGAEITNQILENKTEFWEGAGTGALVALLVMGIGAYFFWTREKRKLKAKFDTTLDTIENSYRLKPEGNARTNDPENMGTQIKISERKVPAESETGPKQEFIAPSVSPPPPPPPPPPVILKKIYARSPNGRLLYSLSDYFEPQSTYFVIEVNPNDPRAGKLSLVDDAATRSHAFSMIDSLRDACEFQNNMAVQSTVPVEEIPGEVYLENGYWTIIKKIRLKW